MSSTKLLIARYTYVLSSWKLRDIKQPWKCNKSTIFLLWLCVAIKFSFMTCVALMYNVFIFMYPAFTLFISWMHCLSEWVPVQFYTWQDSFLHVTSYFYFPISPILKCNSFYVANSAKIYKIPEYDHLERKIFCNCTRNWTLCRCAFITFIFPLNVIKCFNQ